MAKITFLLVFVLSLGFSFAGIKDQDDPINQMKDGKKQGLWIYFGKDRPESGIPASGKVEEGKFVDDRKEGVWIKYHEDGKTKKLEGTYVNNRPKGDYTKYWPNGKTREVGSYDRNMQKGELKRFHDNGQLEYSATFTDDGKENGPVKYYYDNGQVEYEYTAEAGKLTGTATRYYSDGSVKEKAKYDSNGGMIGDPVVSEPKTPEKTEKNSTKLAPTVGGSPDTKGVAWKPNGFNKVFKKGEIWLDGTFKNGNLWDGKEYVYDADGILQKVRVYKEGYYHSDGQL